MASSFRATCDFDKFEYDTAIDHERCGACEVEIFYVERDDFIDQDCQCDEPRLLCSKHVENVRPWKNSVVVAVKKKNPRLITKKSTRNSKRSDFVMNEISNSSKGHNERFCLFSNNFGAQSTFC